MDSSSDNNDYCVVCKEFIPGKRNADGKIQNAYIERHNKRKKHMSKLTCFKLTDTFANAYTHDQSYVSHVHQQPENDQSYAESETASTSLEVVSIPQEKISEVCPDANILECRTNLKTKLEEIMSDDRKLDTLLKSPFLIKLLGNVTNRFYHQSPHDPTVRSFFGRLAIRGDAYTSSMASHVVSGPSYRTIRRLISPKIPVLDYIDDSNLREHFSNFRIILQSRLPKNHSLDDVISLLPSDATATTGDIVELLVSKEPEDFCLVGCFHPYNERVSLKASESLFDANQYRRCSSLNVILLVPLIPRSFVYHLVTYPLSAQKDKSSGSETEVKVGKEVFKAVTERIAATAKDFGINVECDPGDGDARLRSLQHGGEFSFMPHTQIAKHEYPPSVCFNQFKRFTIQDILHQTKKLINNCKYLSTKLLMMCDKSRFDIAYTIRWDVLFDCVAKNPVMRKGLRKTSLILMDKQDPSIASEISILYDEFRRMGYKAMGAYLQCIHLLIMAFYDKSIDLKQRVINIWCVRTFFTLWYEYTKKRKMVGKHFITIPTYKDLLTCCDGLLCYLIKCVTEYPDAFIMPWLVTSDPLEQVFGKVRTGESKGRQTKLTLV